MLTLVAHGYLVSLLVAFPSFLAWKAKEEEGEGIPVFLGIHHSPCKVLWLFHFSLGIPSLSSFAFLVLFSYQLVEEA